MPAVVRYRFRSGRGWSENSCKDEISPAARRHVICVRDGPLKIRKSPPFVGDVVRI
jgi:hypothetical protein